jgi:hypothetical protein
MDTIIDLFNNTLIYIENNIWFKFISISKLLNYKSNKDTLRDLVNKLKYLLKLKIIRIQYL